MVIEKLSECPFCGGRPLIEYNEEKCVVFVECQECHAKSKYAKVSKIPTFETIDEASAYVVGAWERRPKE